MFLLRKILFFSLLGCLVVYNLPSCSAEEIQTEINRNILILLKTKRCPGCVLAGVNFNRVELVDADLRNADLRNATFFLANLKGTNFQSADVRGAKFGGADLNGADFREAMTDQADFITAYLKGALFGEKSSVYEQTENRVINNQAGVNILPTGLSAPVPKKIQPIADVKIE